MSIRPGCGRRRDAPSDESSGRSIAMIHSDSLPTLTRGRSLLRALTAEDAPSLFAIFSDREVMRYWSHRPFSCPSQALDFLDEIRKGFESKTMFQWGLARSEDDLVIGTCTLWQLDPQNQRAEVGFALARNHWGQGWMSEGLTALIEFSFSTLGLRRLEADVDPANEASIALLERLGFVREGLMRERWLVEGVASDSAFLGLLRKDWDQRDAA